jgi:hypothetical protein
MNKQQVSHMQKNASPRRSRMVLVLLGVVLIVPLVLLIGIITSLWYANTHRPSVGDAMKASGQYYQAIQRHDYTTAYHSLDQHTTITVQSRPVVMNSLHTLATASQALDTRDGVISGYIATDGHFEQGTTIVDLTMQVTRTGHFYDVHLKLELASGSWKILSADGL